GDDDTFTVDGMDVVTGEVVMGTGNDIYTQDGGSIGRLLLGFRDNGAWASDDAGTTNTATITSGTTSHIFGTGGIDIITVETGAAVGGGIFTGNDTDTLTVNSTIIGSNVDLGNDDDTFDITGTGGVNGVVTMGRGNDTFTMDGTSINELRLGFRNNSSWATTDDAGTTNTATINTGTVNSHIFGTGGIDIITIEAGASVGGTITTGNDADVVTVNGTSVGGSISTGNGNDVITWLGGTLGGQIIGGNGNDTAVISSAAYAGDVIIDGTNFNDFVNNNGTPLDPSDDFVVTDTFVDTLTFDGANTGVNANTIRGWENVSAVNSTLDFDSLRLNGVSATGNNNVATALNVTGGDVTLSGASILADLLGSASNEVLTVTGTTVVSNAIEGGGGADTISVLGDASVTNGVFGGSDGHDASTSTDAGDTITINTTGTVALVDGGLGDDNINLIAGSVPGSVLGQEGDDTVTVFDGFTVTSLMDGGSNTAVGDTFAVDTATTQTFDGTQVVNFENLQKDNTGTLILTGDQT
ncbi:beta strand repeat-containing protein, partial [Ruegeria sp. HKCCD8929]|uniref:beta strand repeat-containing protein n=1 Tax=Ruegeria sp. HKCCD8929 TaxID=2683006 RepID=UPI0035301172